MTYDVTEHEIIERVLRQINDRADKTTVVALLIQRGREEGWSATRTADQIVQILESMP